jgi:hypothetical protein
MVFCMIVIYMLVQLINFLLPILADIKSQR